MTSTTASERQSEIQMSGKIAIITGASRGIGRAIALRLATTGARLVLTARSEDALKDTAEGVKKLGTDVCCVATPDSSPERIVTAALTTFGHIDIVINNAGTTKHGDFPTLSDEDWKDGYEVKLFGAVRLCRTAWPELVRRHGSVINIAGVGGRTADARFTIGSSVNAAVMAFTKSLAQLGIEDGVQVNAVNPGHIRTDRLTQRITDACQRWGVGVEDAKNRMIKEFKIARFGEPEEVAELVTYLISPAGRLLQGALIDADCGYTKGI
jgi:NAD(P)-dependent dehydrogenase (short-subunit alcohol dehydrogenase family)